MTTIFTETNLNELDEILKSGKILNFLTQNGYNENTIKLVIQGISSEKLRLAEYLSKD